MDLYSTMVTAWLPIRCPPLLSTRERDSYIAVQNDFMRHIVDALPYLQSNVIDPTVSLDTPPRDTVDWLVGKSILASPKLTEYIAVCARVTVDIDELKRINDGADFAPDMLDAFAAIDLSTALEKNSCANGVVGARFHKHS